MEFDSTNKGALFRNDDKDSDEDRDYAGTLDVDGAEYWISGWVCISKKRGRKYLSLSVKPKEQKPAASKKSDEFEISEILLRERNSRDEN